MDAQTTEQESTVEPIRVLIADDYDMVRESLAAILRRHQMQVVGEARNGEEAVLLYRQFQPDITLMDIRMPRMDGVTAIRTILAEFPLARIIVLTCTDDEEDNCLRAGAKAVVLKDTAMQQLVRTIWDVAARDPA